MVMIGVDRVAANGDTAAKIGFYGLAGLARYHQIPFYAVSPILTIDLKTPSGQDIPVEERDPNEVRQVNGAWITMPEKGRSPGRNEGGPDIPENERETHG